VGLQGILVGEQVIPQARQMLEGANPVAASRQSHCTPQIFGHLPGRHEQAGRPTVESEPQAHT
jgi:xanthosine utilization system XapX-like protein